jgi:TonB-linked SusC/RagA family outer membrane protein
MMLFTNYRLYNLQSNGMSNLQGFKNLEGFPNFFVKLFAYTSLLAVLFCCLSFSGIAQNKNKGKNSTKNAKTTKTTTKPIKISGVVYTHDKPPIKLAGAKVSIKETTLTTTTNSKGSFQLTFKDLQNPILVVEMNEYETEEIKIGNRKSFNIYLKREEKIILDTLRAAKLQGLINLGYGEQDKRETTSSIEQPFCVSRSVGVIIPKSLDNLFIPNTVLSFDNALQGQIAGVQVTQANGLPMAATQVRIRGGGAIAAGNNPLFVLDGVPLHEDLDFSNPNGATITQNTNFLANLNPNDIESVEVLKDAQATAMYGARGANGVILLTTKKGKNSTTGKTNFNFDYSTGITSATRKPEMLNGTEWLALYNEARSNDGKFGTVASAIDLKNGSPLLVNGLPMTALSGNDAIPNLNLTVAEASRNNTNWIDESLQNGAIQNFGLSARGGNEKTTFFISGAYQKQGSILKTGNFERFTSRINIDNKTTEKLTLGVKFGLSALQNLMPQTSKDGGFGVAQSTALPIFPLRNTNNSYFGEQFFDVSRNPVATMTQNKNTTTAYTLLAGLYANYQIKKNLLWTSQLNTMMYSQNEQQYFSPKTRFYTPAGQNTIGLGALDERNLQNLNWLTSHYLTYNTVIDTVHRLTVVGGFELQNNTLKTNGYETKKSAGFRNDYYTEVVNSGTYIDYEGTGLGLQNQYNSTDTYRFMSGFLRVNYTWKDKYLVGLTARADGSSRFGENNRIGLFPSISAGWIISEEKFLRYSNTINFLKFRTSYGVVGNAQVGNFNWLGATTGANSYLGQNGIQFSRLPNPDLSWESKTMLDISADFGMLNNRLSGTISFYQNSTSAILLQRPIQTSTGFNQLITNDKNISFRDRGVELLLNYQAVKASQKDDFEWFINFNIAHNSNIVTNADGLSVNDLGDNNAITRVIEGQPLGVFYLAKSAGVESKTGLPLIETADGLKIQATQNSALANRRAVGNPNPFVYGGLNNSFYYKGFDFSVLFSFSLGNKIYDESAAMQVGTIGESQWNQRKEVLNRWQKEGDITNVPRLSTENGALYHTDRWLYDASFVRLRNLSIGYTLPESITSKIKLKKARIYVSGQNLLLFTPYEFGDPEVLRFARSNQERNLAFAVPYLATPQVRTMMIGVNIGL